MSSPSSFHVSRAVRRFGSRASASCAEVPMGSTVSIKAAVIDGRALEQRCRLLAVVFTRTEVSYPFPDPNSNTATHLERLSPELNQYRRRAVQLSRAQVTFRFFSRSEFKSGSEQGARMPPRRRSFHSGSVLPSTRTAACMKWKRSQHHGRGFKFQPRAVLCGKLELVADSVRIQVKFSRYSVLFHIHYTPSPEYIRVDPEYIEIPVLSLAFQASLYLSSGCHFISTFRAASPSDFELVPMLLFHGTDPEHIGITSRLPFRQNLVRGITAIEFGRDMPEVHNDRSLDPRVVLYLGVIAVMYVSFKFRTPSRRPDFKLGYIIPRSGTFHVRAIHHLFYGNPLSLQFPHFNVSDVDIAPASARARAVVAPKFVWATNILTYIE
ncbi:hypothetical protein B0H11DRAFT_1921469 [Mycena galericulata]|nr:hypothetical protein B0H11DRAFT_1921469 [Mycena galericulata]